MGSHLQICLSWLWVSFWPGELLELGKALLPLSFPPSWASSAPGPILGAPRKADTELPPWARRFWDCVILLEPGVSQDQEKEKVVASQQNREPPQEWGAPWLRAWEMNDRGLRKAGVGPLFRGASDSVGNEALLLSLSNSNYRYIAYSSLLISFESFDAQMTSSQASKQRPCWPWPYCTKRWCVVFVIMLNEAEFSLTNCTFPALPHPL